MSNVQELLQWFTNNYNQLPVIDFRDIFEILLIGFAFYHLIIWAKDTRAWMLIKGIIFIGVISLFAKIFEFNTILWIFSKTLNVGIIAVIIVFQPELRRALETLGRRNFITNFISTEEEANNGSEKMIKEIIEAVFDMAKVKTGALIVMEQSEKLDEYAATGINIGAVVTRQLLVNIFEHNTPLHDGAVIIRNNKIIAATCYLPLSDNMSLSKELGTRHRAAIGMAEVSDAVVITVSEETGFVSLALGGNLVRNVEPEYLKNKLLSLYIQKQETKKLKLWRGLNKHAKETNK